MDQFDEHGPSHDGIGRKVLGNRRAFPFLPGAFERFDPVLNFNPLHGAQAAQMVRGFCHGRRTPEVGVSEGGRFRRRSRVLLIWHLRVACADV
jgi:hypothetical protein